MSASFSGAGASGVMFGGGEGYKPRPRPAKRSGVKPTLTIVPKAITPPEPPKRRPPALEDDRGEWTAGFIAEIMVNARACVESANSMGFGNSPVLTHSGVVILARDRLK